MQAYNSVTVTKDGKEETDHRQLGIKEMLSNLKGLEGISEMVSASGAMNVMSEMINNQTLLDQQYDVIAGNWPKSYDEVVLVVGKNNSLSKMTLYMLGILDTEELQSVDLSNYKPEAEYAYYWGSGWSKYGFGSMEDWTNYLDRYAQSVRNPLVVTY
jgi:hypothetical protein